MKSKILIDVDQDNQPIIKIEYSPSEDVRDKLVKKFLETFGSYSCWAKFQYNNWTTEQKSLNKEAIIRPICAYDLPEEVKTMQIEANLHLSRRDDIPPIEE